MHNINEYIRFLGPSTFIIVILYYLKRGWYIWGKDYFGVILGGGGWIGAM